MMDVVEIVMYKNVIVDLSSRLKSGAKVLVGFLIFHAYIMNEELKGFPGCSRRLEVSGPVSERSVGSKLKTDLLNITVVPNQ